MKSLTRSEAAAWLLRGDHFCILTHCRPDGDTLGSAAALCLGLRKLGKTAHVLQDPTLSGKLAFLMEGLTKPEPEPGDTLVAVDVAVKGMVQPCCQGRAIALRVDHHGTGSSYAECEIVDPGAAACGEIIYDLLLEMGVELDPEIAKALYVAVSTDTGCFRFANTTAATLSVAAACARTGAELYPINQALFDTNSLKKLKIHSYIVENTKFYRNGTLALCSLPTRVESGATADDMDNISGFLRSIEGVELAALLRERESGARLSVRAVPGYDASAVCAHFGGGGHKGASGANIPLPLKEAEQAVEKVLLEMYPEG